MKHLKLYLTAFLLAVLGIVACDDNWDTPPFDGPQAPISANTTIADLKAAFWSNDVNYIDTIGTKDDGSHYIIAGRVVSSDKAGNVYKNLVIQDGTAALTISINANSLYNTYAIGQEIVIDATGMYIGKYAGLQQLGMPEFAEGYGWQASFMPLEFFKQHAYLNGLPDPSKVEAKPITIGSLPSDEAGVRQWQSQLVRIDGASFTEGGKNTFATEKQSQSRDLTDGTGTLIVRTSGYANFYNTTLPEGEGSVTGILSYFNNSWQLILRDIDDCQFGSIEGSKTNPYTVQQAIENQGKSTGWVKGYIVGAVGGGVSTVASNGDIEWKAPFSLPNTLVIAASATENNYKNCLVVELPANSALRTAANLKDTPANLGKEITLKGTFAGVLGMAGITGNTGTDAEFIFGSAVQPGGDGDGTEANPYSVAQVQGGATGTAWVKGYIVGVVDGKSIDSDSKFTAEGIATYSNILIADAADVKDASKCVPVQLVSGSDARSARNLVDNPGNLGKAVSLQGTLTKYFGKAGVKETSAFKIDGGGTTPPVTPDVTVTSIDENFDTYSNNINSLLAKGWKNVQVSGDKKWFITTFSNNSYAAMTGYKGTKPPFDSWLITPAVDMSKVASKTLSFRTQVNGYGNKTSVFEVYVLSSSDPATATKTKLSPVLPTAPGINSQGKYTYSEWAESGALDLSKHTGKIYIGFRFHATQDANYATWCVDNVKLGL